MSRLWLPFAFASTLAACTWPPALPSTPATPNPTDTVQEQTDTLPRPSVPAVTLPRVSPPAISVPRVGGGGLLR